MVYAYSNSPMYKDKGRLSFFGSMIPPYDYVDLFVYGPLREALHSKRQLYGSAWRQCQIYLQTKQSA